MLHHTFPTKETPPKATLSNIPYNGRGTTAVSLILKSLIALIRESVSHVYTLAYVYAICESQIKHPILKHSLPSKH